MTSNSDLALRAQKIKLLLTDVDGVLTDAGVYYGPEGEVLKRFSIRDGMGVERLVKLCGVETGIITGERSPSVAKRAEKLKISELHLGIKDKLQVLNQVVSARGITYEEVAYIGDDVNDLQILALAGLSACPSDAMDAVKEKVHYICTNKGGHGSFREIAELIIKSKQTE